MAAEAPPCDVLCEAMEYLSKLGSNLRTRSESLKEKRIRRDKLKNAHAVHKAARKVLLICELSKKSLENVETGVRRVLSIVGASQAHQNIGGKTIDKKKPTKANVYHFEFDSHKLRISKKISLKHYMSVKVFAKRMSDSMQEKYPVFYDCKLKWQRIKQSLTTKPEDKLGRSSRKSLICHSDINLPTEKSKEHGKVINIESDASETEQSKKDKTSRNKFVNSDLTIINRRKSENVKSNSEAEDDIEPTCLENKTNVEKNKSNEDPSVSDLIKCFENVAKVEDNLSNKESNSKKSNSDDPNTNGEKHKRRIKETTSMKSKFSKIKIVDNSSESDEGPHKRKQHDITQKENESPSGKKIETDSENNSGSEPRSKKLKLAGDDDFECKENSDNNVTGSKNSENNQKDVDDDSKPLIRCVNITKLLKPDVLDSKISDKSHVEQNKKNKNDMNGTKKQRTLSEDKRVSRRNKNATISTNDDEYWAQKRSEVKQFKPKQFSVKIERLPKLTTSFLLTHNLNRIIQHCKTICEVTKEKDEELDLSLNQELDKVKNALLDDSASDDADSIVSAEAMKVKKTNSEKKKPWKPADDSNSINQDKETDPAAIKDALLNESDSENNSRKEKSSKLADDNNSTKRDKTTDPATIKDALLNESDSENNTEKEKSSKLADDNNPTNQDKITDPTAIKDALLNESGSDNNAEENEVENNKALDSPKELGQGEAEKIKSALLNDSDSDKDQNEADSNERISSSKESNNSNEEDVVSQHNEQEKCDSSSKTIEKNESTQDPEKIKSSLLNDSSDQSSDSEPSISKSKMSKKKRKNAMKSKQAKKMLLQYSSSSENEEQHSPESKNSKKHKNKQTRRKSRISSSSEGNNKKDAQDAKSNADGHSNNEDKDINIEQVDGTVNEQSDSSVSKMVRSKAKPSGSSSQNSDNQDASDKDIDGLTNLNNLNKPRRRRGSTSTNNTETRSSTKSSRKKPTPTMGEDLLQQLSSSDASDDENMPEEDLPPVNLSGLNGGTIDHLAKDDLLRDSDSSATQKTHSETEDMQAVDDSGEEDSVKLKRRKANTISSDSEGGTSKRKQLDEDVKVSDFDSEDESSESNNKRSKRKKKVYDSDVSGGSSDDGGKKKRRRIKQVDSDASGSDTENEGRNKHGRKNIRKVMGKNQLEEATKKAAREEKERVARIAERQKLYNNLQFDESGKPDEVVLEKVVLDFDPETKEPLIEVDRGLVKKLKPHQANGIKFMWDACFESVKRIKKDKGSGCILAHCMGLGKTLQVISLTHTLLIHGSLTHVNRVLVVCPLSTVLNWVNEFKMWLKHAHSEFEVDVYELSRYKQNSERAFQLQQWFEGGGVCVLGYEMFRNLSSDTNKKFKKKMLRSFQESLVDPGPDLVVCDEGHLLKNEKTSLSQSMNRVKTRRRIVLTGTPLQNNLKEYYCMVQFVKPNLLGKYNEYLNRFVNPITNGQYTDSTEYDIKVMKRRSHVLHKMLDGAVQRRDYGVLAPFLPPKHEFVLFITLSEVQIKLYQFYLDNYSRRPLAGKSSGFLFPDFQSLQRIWTHPLVLKYNSERYEIMQQKKRDREEEDSEGSLVDFIDDDSTAEETSTEESSDDLSDASDDSRKKSKKKKSAKKGKGKESKGGSRRGTRANPVEIGDEDPVIPEALEAKNENPTEWWIKLVEDEELDDMRNSHKLVLLFDILRQCEAIGDKLLVFSQSLYSLDLIEHFLGKVDEATQEGRIDEKLGGHVGSWSPGVDYFRLDGSTSCENRSIWCKNFNREDNPRARLFLISTRAGGLGINLVAANRVVIFDVSWNPSHDVQSIFRVYRFGQKKPCYIYRFLAMGTMEEKIYERQVTKQAISKRVIDEQQIDRHYAENDLAELYKFEAHPEEPRPLPSLPKDRLFAEMLREHEAQIYKFHEHDSLLENKEEETLSEEERKAAWEDFENEKNKPPPAPFPSAWPMHNGMVPNLLAQQQQQLAFAALTAMLRKDMPNINDNQIRDMLPLIYNSNPGLMQKMGEIYKYAQPGMMNPGMMNPAMNAAASGGSAGSLGGSSGSSGLQYEPPWQRQHQQQQQMRLQQLMQQQNQMSAKFYAGGLGSRDPVAMAMQQQRAREIMMGGGAGRPRGRPPLTPRPTPAPTQDVVNLDSD